MRIVVSILYFLSTSLFSYCQTNEVHYSFLSADDSASFKELAYLYNEKPNMDNIKKYSRVARLYEYFGQKNKSIEMLQAILAFKVEPYVATKLVTRDGTLKLDSVKNVTEPPYSSSIKFESAIRLSEFLIDDSNFVQADKMLARALKDYQYDPICGTSAYNMNSRIRRIKRACDIAFDRTEKDLDKLFKKAFQQKDFYWSAQDAVAVLKKKYSAEQIKNELQKATQSIKIISDTVTKIDLYSMEYGKKVVHSNFAGSASIMLFGHRVILPALIIKPDEKITTERYQKWFIGTSFYRMLIE